jgi:NADH-quinone oxidoreductase subunit L
LSYGLYFKPSPWPARLAGRFRPIYQASLNKFYVDEFYSHMIVWPTRFLGLTANFLDNFLVTGLVGFVAGLPRGVGRYLLGPRQNGLIQYYAAVTALGVGLFLVFLLFRITD